MKSMGVSYMLSSNFWSALVATLVRFLIVILCFLVVLSGVYSTVNIVNYYKSSSGSVGDIEQFSYLKEELGTPFLRDNPVDSNQLFSVHDDSYFGVLDVNYVSFSEKLDNKTAPALNEIARLESSPYCLLAFYLPSNFVDFDLFIQNIVFKKCQSNESVRYLIVDYSVRPTFSNLEKITLNLVKDNFNCIIETSYSFSLLCDSVSKSVVKITPSFVKYI